MAGLLSSTTTPTTNTPIAGQATDWMNTPDQTVAGQMEKLTATDSPLMQQARTGAKQAMNQRGLLNSSMAVGAADMAAYNAAMPIAQADAAQASKVAGTNAGATNDMSKLQTQIQGQKDITGMQTTAARDVAEMEATYKTITQGSSAATTIMQNMQNALNVLSANKDITDATKRTALEAQIKQNAKDSLEMIGALAGDTDIAKYLS